MVLMQLIVSTQVCVEKLGSKKCTLHWWHDDANNHYLRMSRWSTNRRPTDLRLCTYFGCRLSKVVDWLPKNHRDQMAFTWNLIRKCCNDDARRVKIDIIHHGNKRNPRIPPCLLATTYYHCCVNCAKRDKLPTFGTSHVPCFERCARNLMKWWWR